MSWHFSQALEAASSGGISSGGEPSAPSSSTPTPAMFFCPARTTDAFRPSRSGMTCEPLTADRGEALLTWCLADSRARTSPPPARVPESAASEADSGARWHALLVKFSPDSCGWKTARCLWEEDLDWSCLTLPRWGSLHDGELWERATPGLPTSETASGFWRTPCATDGTNGGPNSRDSGGSPHLSSQVHLWPTPRASEAGPDFAKLSRSKTGISLQTAVAMWPTPRAANPGSRPNGKGGKILSEEVAIAEGLRERGQKMWPTPHGMSKDGKSNGPSGNELGNAVNRSMYPTPRTTGLDGGSNSNTFVKEFPLPFDQFTPDSQKHDPRVGGSLNPTWVEWLMGWPLGWTDCAVSATDKFRQWFASHTGS